MADIQSASLDSPGEVRTFDKGMAELTTVGENTIGRFTFEPGWKWSECIKPIAKTDTCQNHHVGVAVAGKIHVEIAGGSSADISAGDVYDIPPGHDAWVVGDDTFVGYEFKSAASYAKPAGS